MPTLILSLLLLCGATLPPADQTVRLHLAGGDQLTGVLLETTSDGVLLQHPVLGTLRVPLDALDGPLQELDSSGTPVAPEPEPEPTAEPTPGTGPEPAQEEHEPAWKGSAEAGLDGNQGNTDQTNLRVAWKARLETDEHITELAASRRYARKDDVATDDQALLEGRYQWLKPGTPWRNFLQGSVERDRFKAFHHRMAVSGGSAYAFTDDDTTSLVGRIGVGLVKRTGVDDATIDPEGVLGLDYRHALENGQAVTASADVFPNMRDWGEFRFLGRAGWDLPLSQHDPWSLRLGLEMDHDSEAEQARSSDYYYTMSLAYTF